MARLAREAGYPSYASDGTSKFTPSIWSAIMIEKFYPATVLAAISNIDHEDEISAFGDSIYIRTTPDIAISDYVVGQDLTYETPESPNVLLEINKGKTFAFKADDVDIYQSDLDLMGDWAESAAQHMKVTIDRDVLADFYADAAAENQGLTAGKISGDINMGVSATPRVLTPTDIVDFIVDAGTVLDEQDVPETDRWLVMPASLCAMVKKSDLRDASIAGDTTSIVRNGRIGTIDRFTVYSSNQVSKVGAEYNVVAGHVSGLSFAAQMDKMETLKNPNAFGDLVRGMNIFGYKVLKPESIVHAVVSK